MNHLGGAAEQVAATFLQQKGLIMVANNYQCRYGEIDLIMRDGSTLVFVEVRLRSSARFGGAGISITAAKRQKLTRTAEHYLQQHGSKACRFDAVLMSAAAADSIKWIRNAFESQ